MSLNVMVIGPRFQVSILKDTLLNSDIETNDIKMKFIYRAKSTTLNILLYLKLLHIINKSDVVHIIYPSHRLSFKIAQYGLKRKKRVILHWIGSDILLAKQRRLFKEKNALLNNAINVTVAPWLKEELKEINVNVNDVIPLVPSNIFNNKPLPLPKVFSILFYLPKNNFNKIYNPELISELIAFISNKLRNTNVLIVGGGSVHIKRENVLNFGRVPRHKMQEIYKNTTVLVRYTKHDGLPLMVLEALTYGRYVIFNKPMKYVIYVRNKEEILQNLLKLNKLHIKGLLKPYIQGRSILNEFNREYLARKLINLWLNYEIS